ncbi:MAG TPA: M50 family metallopeptidase [Gaiellaceae bacterium]|jgi:regulator of sigma E protease|nr:M50 family metallopeptidase [Gaiellaceae bacterium]
MSLLVSIAGLAFLILIHEAGHFFTARAVGMRPRRFYIGFPPAVMKTTRNGIEYGLGAIPLGGYVKIPGMHRPAPSDLDVHFGPALYESPRLLPDVERVKRSVAQGDFASAGSPLRDLEHAVGEAPLSANARRAADRGLRELEDALGADAYWRQRTWKRLVVIAAGPGANLLFAIALLASVYMIGIPSDASRRVGDVIPGSPAATAGLKADDVIVGVNRVPTYDFKEVRDAIRKSDGQPLVISVLRDGNYVELKPARPQKTDGVYTIGFHPSAVKYKRYGPIQAVGLAGKDTWLVTKAMGSWLTHVVSGSGRKEVSTPVGIVRQSSKAVEVGYREYLQVLALISLSLALLNLLPLLPLDGGHMAFSIIEGLRGRAVGRVVYERVSAVGIALVLLLFFVGLSNDIGNIRGG